MDQSGSTPWTTYSYRISRYADFEFVWVGGEFEKGVKEVELPFKGRLSLAWRIDGTVLWLDCRWGENVPVGAFGECVAPTFELYWLDRANRPHLVRRSAPVRLALPAIMESGGISKGRMSRVESRHAIQAAASSEGKFDPANSHKYRIVVTIEQAYPQPPPTPPSNTPESQQLAERISGSFSPRCMFRSDQFSPTALHLEPLPYDVRIAFPNGADLWSNKDLLERSSPFFQSLLSSGFSESVVRRSKHARRSTPSAVEAPEVAVEKDFDDSDDETDTFLAAHPLKSETSSSDTEDLSYRRIDITQHSYSTYHALLVYLQSGFISFTPLTPSFPSSQARLDFLSTLRDTSPLLPLPCSPKSMYRLAHLLGLDDLQKRCLEALPSSLSTSNMAQELFNDTSIAYDVWRSTILSYVKENRTAIRTTEEWTGKMRDLKSGEGASAGTTAVMVELMEVVMGL